MMDIREILLLASCLFIVELSAQGPYAPAVGEMGNKAIQKDSSLIRSWAADVIIERGFQDIAIPSLGRTTIGDSSNVIGRADLRVVSLGDGGEAIVKFELGLFNGQGPDFAVFENAFNDSFLELAFIEVSSDGVNYFRFHSHSLTDTSRVIGSFGALDPTNINNLAGKYRGGYGTPFDLDELKNISGLNINKVTHIKVVDVIGSLDSSYVRRDHFGNKISEIYPTPFPSGGFDLDAIGAIHINPTGIQDAYIEQIAVFPNPVVEDFIQLKGDWKNAQYQIYTSIGQLREKGIINSSRINLSAYEKGVYLLRIEGLDKKGQVRLIKQ